MDGEKTLLLLFSYSHCKGIFLSFGFVAGMDVFIKGQTLPDNNGRRNETDQGVRPDGDKLAPLNVCSKALCGGHEVANGLYSQI